MKLYKIIADYRSNNSSKPAYYVWGQNKKEARDRFANVIGWLKIYECEEVIDGVDDILSAPDKHIII